MSSIRVVSDFSLHSQSGDCEHKISLLPAHTSLAESWHNSAGIESAHGMFEYGLSLSASAPFLGRRVYEQKRNAFGTYEWMTYGKAAEMRTALGAGLLHINSLGGGGNSKERLHVGIYSINRPEWVVTDLAIHAYSMVNVALYDTLGPDAARFILNHSETSIVVCSADKLASVLSIVHCCPSLRAIVSMDELDKSESSLMKAWGKDRGVRVYEWMEVLECGRKNPIRHRPPKPEEAAALCYTSGTTGNPKGAILLHRQLVCAMVIFEKAGVKIKGSEEAHLSYLPLAHCYERTIYNLVSANGARIGFYSGDVNRLQEDLAELKPTIFIAVPRVLNKIYEAICAKTIKAAGFKGWLCRKAVSAKLDNMKKQGTIAHAFYDRLIFRKVKAALGGQVKLMVCGSAPISPHIIDFLRVCLCCDVVEGYGTTETCAFGAVMMPGDYTSGHVGQPPFCCEAKVVDVPELGYFASDKPSPRGELCFRGPIVFGGYYKDEDKTKEAIEADGWLHTGDIAALDLANGGKIWIIDRKKNIFKLAHGEYIAPEKLENIYLSNSQLVAQIFVYGDSLKAELVAIVVPDEETVAAMWPEQTFGEMCAKDELKEAIMKDLDHIAGKARLNKFEYIRDIYIEHEPFSIENDLITPTMKLKRAQVQSHYARELDGMYGSLGRQSRPTGFVFKSKI